MVSGIETDNEMRSLLLSSLNHINLSRRAIFVFRI